LRYVIPALAEIKNGFDLLKGAAAHLGDGEPASTFRQAIEELEKAIRNWAG
jgi:hypothetical protein